MIVKFTYKDGSQLVINCEQMKFPLDVAHDYGCGKAINKIEVNGKILTEDDNI